MTQKFPNGTIVKFKSGSHFGGHTAMNFAIQKNHQWKAVKDQKLTVISYNTDMNSYQLKDDSGNIIYPNVKEDYLTTPWFGGKKSRKVKKSKRKHTRKSKKTNKKRRSTRRR